jgi:hypothetical protein
MHTAVTESIFLFVSRLLVRSVSVILDVGHNPPAFERMIELLRASYTEERIIGEWTRSGVLYGRGCCFWMHLLMMWLLL